MSYRELEAAHIVRTAETLQLRVAERFPGSGLSRVAGEFTAVSREAEARIRALRRPRWGLRIGTGLLVLVIVGVALVALMELRPPDSFRHLGEFVQVMESAINDVVFVGIAIAFLVTLEGRLRRRDALRALHELRSLVHIVDMHQLTKDPDQFLAERRPTSSSPSRTLTPAELSRYLDYCSELLSLTGKVAALYAQQLEDPVVLGAVSEVEALTTGLSGKIWQKLVILGTAVRAPRASGSAG